MGWGVREGLTVLAKAIRMSPQRPRGVSRRARAVASTCGLSACFLADPAAPLCRAGTRAGTAAGAALLLAVIATSIPLVRIASFFLERLVAASRHPAAFS